MELTERYLAAIGRNLPKDQAADIVAELREALLAEREGKEDGLGRALNRDEEEALIRGFGHPLVVAARYRANQQLIGPEFYPFYVYVLRLVLMIVGAVLLTLMIAGLVFQSGDPGQVIGRAIGAFWTGGFITVGVVTIIFAALDRYAPHAALAQKWRPRDLPPAQTKRQSRFDVITEITADVVFILWWTGVIHMPDTVFGHDDRIVVGPAPIWDVLWWPILVLVGFHLAVRLVALARPGWETANRALKLAASFAGLILLAILWRAGEWVIVTGHDVSAATLAKVTLGIDIGVKVTMVVVGLVWIYECLREVWSIVRPTPANRAPGAQ